MDIAIPLFDKMTALDAVGPYEVLWRLPDVKASFVGERIGQGHARATRSPTAPAC